MKIKILLIFLLVLSVLIPVKAQGPNYKFSKTFRVNAINGLNLREEPNKKGKILAKMPYFSKVENISDLTFGLDTAETIQLNDNKAVIITGYWLHVNFNGYKGYALSSYLSRPPKRTSIDTDEYALLIPNWGCIDQAVDIRKYHWLGVYKCAEGFNLKPVELQCINSDSYHINNHFTSSLILTDAKIQPLYIIGSIDTLTPGIKKGNFVDNQRGLDISWDRDTLIKLSNNLVFSHYYSKNKNSQSYLTTTNGKYHQILNSTSNFTNYVHTDRYWEGDLDGDGVMDYILTFGDKGGSTVLFLSSQANENELVKAVARFYWTYCC